MRKLSGLDTSRDRLKEWVAVDIVVEVEAVEAVESAFNTLDSLGNEIGSFRNEAAEQQRVTGYFEVLPDEIDIRVAVDESLQIYGFSENSVKSIATRGIEQTDWLAEWKKHWKPSTIGNFIIAPPWADVDETDKVVIRIEPSMAFGTGTHETTQLCLQAVSENYRAGQTFLDVGTGTGILAIAAAKMQVEGQKIFACDNDADSVKIALANAVANGVSDIIEFNEGSVTDETPVSDFVCANLTLDVILPMLPRLLDKADEILVLSGVLVEQRMSIEAELQKFGISNFKFQIKGEWLSIIVEMN